MPMLMLPLFGPEVNSLDHSSVVSFRKMLEEGCRAYGGQLSSFAIDHGVVAFGVTSEDLAKDMLEDLASLGLKVEIIVDDNAAFQECRKMLDGARKNKGKRRDK